MSRRFLSYQTLRTSLVSTGGETYSFPTLKTAHYISTMASVRRTRSRTTGSP
ncbi:unnamed protein product [Oppiella nova]|uniref:Uncharacterized protein n=1 Tax=Oppiella nova TaxID=334625 RepID=A0A7R9MVW3_9ACAR|nr:unnamed protein product [Oppiella nova]CAG2183323.1 unnamed protein product [Oppiella nova]